MYEIPTAPSSDNATPSNTTISLPERSNWTSGLHFHATYAEHLRLVRGAIFVELDGKTRFFSTLSGGKFDPKAGLLKDEGLIVEVFRYTKHNWGRTDEYYRSLNSRTKTSKPYAHHVAW